MDAEIAVAADGVISGTVEVFCSLVRPVRMTGSQRNSAGKDNFFSTDENDSEIQAFHENQ